MKEIRLEVKVRNNLLLTAMEEKGITSVAELCRCMYGKNYNPSKYVRLVELTSMKIPAKMMSGDWNPAVLLLAKFFRMLPEDLFVGPMQYAAIEKNRIKAEVSFAEMQRITGRKATMHLPEHQVEADELRDAIDEALQTLPPRQMQVIKKHFGFGEKAKSYSEIAEELAMSKGRAHQLLHESLEKLKRLMMERHFPTKKVLVIDESTGKPINVKDKRFSKLKLLDIFLSSGLGFDGKVLEAL